MGPTGRKEDFRQRPLSLAHDIHLFSRASNMPHTSGMSKLSALPRGTAQARIEAINRSAADVVFKPSIRDASAGKLRRAESLSTCL
jgi:hypothetical protein